MIYENIYATILKKQINILNTKWHTQIYNNHIKLCKIGYNTKEFLAAVK